MSTIFGIKMPNSNELTPIAKRTGGKIFFTDDIGYFLSIDTKVIAMNNDSQGIDTIEDIRLAILKQK